jgi:hypothetical protein
MLAVLAGLTTTAQAQRAWQSEIGIQGGYSRFVNAGSGGSHTDVLGLPGFNLGPAAPFTPAIYAILPWKNKIAIELGVSASQLTGNLAATLVEADLRGNFALTNQFYLSAGGGVGFISNGGTSETQLGLQGAVGYRRHLTGPLMGRIEFRTMFWGKTENVGPSDIYSLLFGVSTRTRAAAAPASRSARSANRAWTPQFGISAGYANMHPVGGTDITALAFPGFGGALAAFGSPQYTLPPTLFVIIPVGAKIALEPGLDLHRLQSSVSGSTVFSGNASARLNYALTNRWYAALGGNLNYIKAGSKSASRTGLNTAVGYRFPFTNTFGGRIELNYTMFGKNTALPVPPVNVVGLMFGVTVPLK